VNPETMLLAVVDALAAADVPYFLSGSFASNYYGVPRSTQDADFVIELQDRPIMSLQPHLGPELRLDPQVQIHLPLVRPAWDPRVAGRHPPLDPASP
jgi:hypothetical protein